MADDKASSREAVDQPETTKALEGTIVQPVDEAEALDNQPISHDAQQGVKEIEATTSVWTKNHLVAAYVMIWFIYFIDTLQQSTTSGLLPYVTSSFSAHSLTATTGVLSQLIAGLWKLTLAKILDVWGRPQGYIVSVFVLTVGLIMMAACRNVETYAAAQVFYWVGLNGVGYSLSIFIADTSTLKNRSLMFAFSTSPYLITTWIGGPIATSVLKTIGFNWGFGIFAIITPIVTLPLFFLFMFNLRKAKKQGLVPPRHAGRTKLQSLKHYLVEFDVVGLFIVTVGFALFLIPFNLYAQQPLGWKSPLVISLIVIGGVLIIGFYFWERFFAPVKYLPYELFTDRTIVGACILSAILFVSFFIWDSYFPSFLQVVNDLDITQASYVANTYTMGSCLWALVTGFMIHWTGKFKWLALYFGVPMTILGVALMINFRQPDTNIGYIVMCQVFIALAGGTLVICEQMAAMASVTHQYIAVILAIEGMCANVGGAIGLTVAAAIWQGVFPARLAEYLPEESIGNLTQIVGSILVQKSYPVGSPTRDAINRAYGDAQRIMLIASSIILIGAIAAVAVWRDINVKNFKQVKGTVI